MIFSELIISSGKRLVRLPAQCARSVLAARPHRCRADGGAERSLDSDIVHYIYDMLYSLSQEGFCEGPLPGPQALHWSWAGRLRICNNEATVWQSTRHRDILSTGGRMTPLGNSRHG